MAFKDRYERYMVIDGKLVGCGNVYRKCAECGGEFLVQDDKKQSRCSDCDERLMPGQTLREVILEGGEGFRLNRGLELLDEDFEPPTGEVRASNL